MSLINTMVLCLDSRTTLYPPIVLDDITAMTVERLLIALPEECGLPKIGLDEDGIIMMWEDKDKFVLLVSKHEINMIERATLPNVVYHEHLTLKDLDKIVPIIINRSGNY